MLADAFSADTEHHPGNGLAILCLYNSSTAQVCQLLCVLKNYFVQNYFVPQWIQFTV